MTNEPLGTGSNELPKIEKKSIDQKIWELRKATLEKGLKWSDDPSLLRTLRQTFINEEENDRASRKPSNLSR
jgi:hypothetical protein